MEVSTERVECLRRVAARSVAIREIEADLRRDLEIELVPFARDDVGLADALIRAEGTGRAGRYDALFGGVIIEFKRPRLLDIAGERREASIQAVRYLEDETLNARAVVLTDGKTLGFLRSETGEPDVGEQIVLPFGEEDRPQIPAVNRFSWREFDEGATRALLELIASQRAVGVNAPNLIALLGPQRAEVLTVLTRLVDALAGRVSEGRSALLFEQWIRTAGVAYGIDSSETEWPRAISRLMGSDLATVFDGAGYAETLFVLHTYMGVIAKCIAAEVLAIQRSADHLRPTAWTSLTSSSFVARFIELERGGVAEQLGAPGLLSTDLFDWYAHELDHREDLREAMRDVLRSLGELAWAEVATAGRVRIDLLRQLYQSVVPGPLRKALGEFFTPRWLAQRVLARALEVYETDVPSPASTPRLLDPSCGSGTFLVLWLGHLIDELDQEGLGEDPAALTDVLDRVLGIDINPVSAVMARVNLVLTLGDRSRVLPEVVFNVFHADSIVLPTVTIQAQVSAGGGGGDRMTVSTAAEDFELASWLLDRNRMAAVRRNVESGVRYGLSRDAFVAGLVAEISPIPDEERETVLTSAGHLFERMRELHREDLNDVWVRVIEQQLAPRLLGRIDLVVGNPPWVSWKDLPAAWKRRSEPLWRAYGLWQQPQRSAGIPLSDVSTLLLARSLQSYAPEGLVAMLLPQALLLADPGGAAFRRSHLVPNEEDRGAPGGADLQYRLVAGDDFVQINPFSPDASNRTVALFLRPGEPPSWPVPLRIWRRANRQRIRHEDPWERTRERLTFEDDQVAPVDPRDITSPWGLVAPERSLPIGPRREDRPYAFGRGFETRGLDGYYAYRILTPTPADGAVRVVNDPTAGANTEDEPPREGVFDAALLWPLVKGEDVERWRVNPVDRYIFVPYDVTGEQVEPITVSQCRATYRHAYDYLLPWLGRFEDRSFYRRELTEEFPWALSGPVEYLTDEGALVFIRYLASGGRPAAAVATQANDSRLGRDTLPYPNNKSNIYYTDSLAEAHFLAAFLNSQPAQAALARFAVSTGITPAALERLPLPQFNADDPDHGELARLGERAHSVVGTDALPQIEDEIDDLVWRIAGAAPDA